MPEYEAFELNNEKPGSIRYRNRSGERVALAPGTVNQVIAYDSGGLPAPATLGTWTTVAFTAGDFTSSAGTLTVASGDLISFQYTLIGKTMTVTFEIVTATLATTAAANLVILIPASKTAAKRSVGWAVGLDNGTVAAPAIVVLPATDSAKIFVYRDATLTNTWAVQTDTLAVRGGITFEVA